MGEKLFGRLWQSFQGDTKVLESAHDVTIYTAAILKFYVLILRPSKNNLASLQSCSCQIGLQDRTDDVSACNPPNFNS